MAALAPVGHESTPLLSNSVVSIRHGRKGPQIHVGHSPAGTRNRNDGFILSANPPAGGLGRGFHQEDGQSSDATSQFQSRKLDGILFKFSGPLITIKLPPKGCCRLIPTNRHSL